MPSPFPPQGRQEDWQETGKGIFAFKGPKGSEAPNEISVVAGSIASTKSVEAKAGSIS